METKIESVLNWLIKRRLYVLMSVGLILATSFFVGYIYQNKQTKEREARVLFDDTWQMAYAILNDMQKQPNQQYTPQSPSFAQVTNLYQKILVDLEILTLEYKDTVSGVKAALLVQTLLPLTNLNSLLSDQTVIASLSGSEYLDEIKDKHPDFWGSVLAMNQGVVAEQKLDYATALEFYQEALSLDRKKILGDYITVAIARNNEVLGNTNQAIEYYQQLEDEYPDSVWLSFAMGKKYILSQNNSVAENNPATQSETTKATN